MIIECLDALPARLCNTTKDVICGQQDHQEQATSVLMSLIQSSKASYLPLASNRVGLFKSLNDPRLNIDVVLAGTGSLLQQIIVTNMKALSFRLLSQELFLR